ncbi:sensor histidine kinase [Clostridium sp.]|uniref:sensor histidine kinase n=1 Tax=Clostridium sp. TaxID=1506 RepID=UPI003F2B3900
MSNVKEFSIKGYLGSLLLSSVIAFIFVYIEKLKIIKTNPNLISSVNNILFILIVFLSVVIITTMFSIYSMRKQVEKLCNKTCEIVDRIISGEDNIVFEENNDTMLSKIESKLKNLIYTINEKKLIYKEDNQNIKSLIGDISHQIKTPIANISMYTETILERELSKEKTREFLGYMKWQVDKLDWLVKGLIKMSRLESGIIELKKSNGNISETIANALSGVYLNATKKEVYIEVEGDTNIKLLHDKKWTTEAFFNIIENAVKYSKSGDKIQIIIDRLDLFTRIDIIDNGIGIKEENINNIFKRFYREEEVSEIEGVGIGLYLANEIITKQGGYIKVKSKKGKGSTFSVFLYNNYLEIKNKFDK